MTDVCSTSPLNDRGNRVATSVERAHPSGDIVEYLSSALLLKAWFPKLVDADTHINGSRRAAFLSQERPTYAL